MQLCAQLIGLRIIAKQRTYSLLRLYAPAATDRASTGDPEANIRVSIGCNHHVICYCAMLDYEGTMQATTPVPAGEEDSAACILGPQTGKLSLAEQLVRDLAVVVPV